MNKKRALTGIRPSGDLHIGNYLGTIKPALELQNKYTCTYFLADMHALTTNKDANLVNQYTLDIAAAWLALDLDTEKHTLFRQSDVPMVTELTWYLSCNVGFGFLEKGHAFKDNQSQNKDVNHGVFSYPVLMAADILLYDTDIVPVGKDQKQHVEMARDMAGSFNAVYGDVLHLPKVVIEESVMTIPGLDGRKMSKSYNNVIPLFAPEKQLRKKVMVITTDSTALEEPKVLKGSLLGDLFNLFATKDEFNDLEKRLNAGGLGWGHAKDELFQAINRELSEKRDKYFEYRKDNDFLLKELNKGKEKAMAVAEPVLKRVRKAVGFN